MLMRLARSFAESRGLDQLAFMDDDDIAPSISIYVPSLCAHVGLLAHAGCAVFTNNFKWLKLSQQLRP
jgi:hypothetical protein